MTSRMKFKPPMVSMLVALWLAWCFAYGSDAANVRPPCNYSQRTSSTRCPFFDQAQTDTFDVTNWFDCRNKCNGVSDTRFCWGYKLGFDDGEVEDCTLYMLDSSSPPPTCAQPWIGLGRRYFFCEPIAVSSTTTSTSTTSMATTPSRPTTLTTEPTRTTTAETTRTTQTTQTTQEPQTTAETTHTTSTASIATSSLGELATQAVITTKKPVETSQKTQTSMTAGTTPTTPSPKGFVSSASTTTVDGTSYVPVNQSAMTREIESAVGSSTTVAENSISANYGIGTSDNNTTMNNTNITRKTTFKQMITTGTDETKSSFDNVVSTSKPTLIPNKDPGAKFSETTRNVTENGMHATSGYSQSGQETTSVTTNTTMHDERSTQTVNQTAMTPHSDSSTSLDHPQSTNSKLGFPMRLCTCVCRRNVSLQVPVDPDVIKKNLILDVKTLSSSRRRKESSSDPRPSTAQIGSVWIILILLPLGLIVLSDLPYMYRNARYREFSSAQPSTQA